VSVPLLLPTSPAAFVALTAVEDLFDHANELSVLATAHEDRIRQSDERPQQSGPCQPRYQTRNARTIKAARTPARTSSAKARSIKLQKPCSTKYPQFRHPDGAYRSRCCCAHLKFSWPVRRRGNEAPVLWVRGANQAGASVSRADRYLNSAHPLCVWEKTLGEMFTLPHR